VTFRVNLFHRGGNLTRMSDHPGGQFPHPGQQPAWQNPPAPQGWQQQHYPQQPYPPQQGWPQQQQQGWPVPPKKKGMSTRLKVLLIVGVLVFVGGGVGLTLFLRAAAGPEKQAGALEVGDCAQVTGTGEATDAAKFPCNAPGTPYVVSVAGIDKGEWNCSDGFYRLAIETRLRGEGVALCLGLNGQVGACFDDVDAKTPPPLVDCAHARYKVTEVFPTASIVESPCQDKTAKVISYTSYGTTNFKNSTICLSTP